MKEKAKQIRERLVSLRRLMKEYGVDVYLIVSGDFHASEYVGEYFKCREYMSGFDGSAGTLLVTATEAGLWTDGRYFIQAEEQLQDTGITLWKMGEREVPTVFAYLEKELQPGQCLGYDGRTISVAYGMQLRKKLQAKQVVFLENRDLVGEIWQDRPSLPTEPVWLLSEIVSGKSRREKLQELRQQMRKQGADMHLLASLDDIAWLYNIRGADIAYNPVVRSCIPENCTVICRANPTQKAKAVKNETERQREQQAHIQDGVAVTRLLYWLKQQQGTELLANGGITEREVAKHLEAYRQEWKDYLGPSFAPIIAAGEHGAIVHYEPTEETNAPLCMNTLVLMDTGGHYLQGTTDITRTVALGEISRVQKEHYTAVLCGNLKLGNAYFKYGYSGTHLDYLAREPLWRLGLDFNHGTGHGVGYILSVHEGPQGIRQKEPGGRIGTVLEEGMVLSNEPGVYLPGEYGIRLENLMLCVRDRQTSRGDIMCFETLTMVPFDRDAILPECMGEEELRLLNEYHSKVYARISPYLDRQEAEWLAEITAPLS